MKKTIKTTLYILSSILVCVFVFLQLKNNKAETARLTELATQTGNFYPVKVSTVEAGILESQMQTNGFLKSETDLDVLSETQGIILEIYKKKGDYIKAGEAIAKVDDELLAAQLSAAKANYEQLKKEVSRFTKLFEQNAVTSQKLEEIKLNYQSAEAQYISAKRQFEDSRIKAPVNGFIETAFIEEGQYISRNGKVCNIIDANKLKLQIAVDENDYKHIQQGQKVDISTPVYPSVKFEGIITYIGKKASAGNKFDADIKVVNDTNKRLKAGMFVNANITQALDAPSIYIPRKAINGSLKDASVFVIKNNLAISQKVVTGNTVNDQVEITNGLNSGDLVVIEGNYSIFDSAKVKIID